MAGKKDWAAGEIARLKQRVEAAKKNDSVEDERLQRLMDRALQGPELAKRHIEPKRQAPPVEENKPRDEELARLRDQLQTTTALVSSLRSDLATARAVPTRRLRDDDEETAEDEARRLRDRCRAATAAGGALRGEVSRARSEALEACNLSELTSRDRLEAAAAAFSAASRQSSRVVNTDALRASEAAFAAAVAESARRDERESEDLRQAAVELALAESELSHLEETQLLSQRHEAERSAEAERNERAEAELLEARCEAVASRDKALDAAAKAQSDLLDSKRRNTKKHEEGADEEEEDSELHLVPSTHKLHGMRLPDDTECFAPAKFSHS